MALSDMIAQIERLKHQRNAVILAHSYQPEVVQQAADYVGDSLGLSLKAKASAAEVIVFCGVAFMAESAAILSPEKTVLLPAPQAGCPLADTIDASELRKARKQYPEAAVVSYINSSAAVKAESDICCTSANAVAIVAGLAEQQVLFVPDQNLASYVARRTNKEVIPWAGNCPSHQYVTLDEVQQARAAYPQAPLAVHPECTPEVTAVADFVGSTGAIIDYAAASEAETLIIGTEKGILTQLKQRMPDKTFHMLSPTLWCPDMKQTTLAGIVQALETLSPTITVPEPTRRRAAYALERMLASS